MHTKLATNVLLMLVEEIANHFDEERNLMRMEARRQSKQEAYKKNYDNNRVMKKLYKEDDLVAIKWTQCVTSGQSVHRVIYSNQGETKRAFRRERSSVS